MSERASSGQHSSERLSARRRRNRRRALIALLVLLALISGGFIYLSWKPSFRIAEVKVYGQTSQSDYGVSLSDTALAAMRGTYLGIVPRNSTFFYPASAIRHAILEAHPELAALSLFRNGFTGLTIKIDERTAVARWCGLLPTPGVDEYCYVFDPNGFVFGAYSSSTPTLNGFKLYVPLAGNTEEPLRSILADADRFPATFDFARRLGTMGAFVTSIVIKDGEVTDTLGSGTRVIYVLGDEQNAITALVSSGKNVNLADGSVDYVDLRFDGKVYLKKKVDTPR